RLAKMNIGKIDAVPVLVVARIVPNIAVRLIGNVALLPCRHLRFHLLDVGAGSKFQEDPSRLAAPARQEVWLLGEETVVVHPQDRIDLETRVFRNVPQNTCDLEIARYTLRYGG